jgi:hypothetical protein
MESMEMPRYFITENNEILDTSTGEVISLDEIKRAKEEKVAKELSNIRSELKSLNIHSDLVLIKQRGENYPCVKVKPNHYFQKVFRVEVRELMKRKELSKNARMFIGTLQTFLYFPTNAVIVDGHNPTSEELIDLLDVGRSTYFNTLQELEEKEIIKRVKRNGDIVIYFNPFLFSAGGVVDKETLEMFKNSRFSNLTE